MVAARPVAATSLSHALRQYRTDQAFIRAVPPSAVFSDKLLTSIIKNKPTFLVSLLKLHGIGPTRCQHYGRDIVRLVNIDSKNKAKLATSKPKFLRTTKKQETKGKRKSKTANKRTLKVKKVKSGSNSSTIERKKPNKLTPNAYRNGSPMTYPLKPPLLSGSGQVAVIPKRLPQSPKTTVYVLELEDGRVYVGSSKDVPRRISQHKAGSGSAYTRIYRPTGVQLPRLGNIEGDGDAAERDETLRYMMLRGIPYVRGWKFSRVDMPPEEFGEAEANIRELFNLCRRCGYEGHFCTHCRATFDRLGNPVGM